MIRTCKLAILLGTLAFFLSDCKRTPPPFPPPEVTVVHPISNNVPIKQDFVGQVFGISDIAIRARVDGFLEAILFNEGGMVTKGQKLYLIDATPFDEQVAEAQSAIAAAKTDLTQAENDLARIEPLAEINAVAETDLDAAKANRDAAQSRLDAARAQYNLSKINRDYTEIMAPITGIIGKSQAKVGEYVGSFPNPVILNTVSRIDSILVEFFITEEDYLKFARTYIVNGRSRMRDNDSTAGDQFPINLILSDGTEFGYPGELQFINREVDPTTGTILIQAKFPNPDKLLRPGQFAKVRTVTLVYDDVLLIPQRCVTEIQGIYNVKVVNDSNQVSVRTIDVGPKVMDYILVHDGLNTTDKVVLDGLQKAREGVTVNPELVEFESQAARP